MQGAPATISFFFYILTTQNRQNHNMRRGGLCLPRHVIATSMWREGHTLPTVSFQFWHGREGTVLSLSYRCSNFDAVRRAMPSSPCHLPLRCGGEGMPLPTMSFQFWCGREGTVPSLSYCSSNFDSVRRGMPPPHRVVAISMQQGGPTPPHCVFIPI